MNKLKIKDFSVSQHNFELVYNANLDLYQTRPIPENLGFYYESEDYISHTDAKTSLIDKLYQAVKKITIKSKTSLLYSITTKSKASVLDIGCGTGSFLEALKNKSWNVIGAEPNQGAKSKAEEKGIDCVSKTNEIGQKFDIITMWHVLEHVPDLEAQFNEFKRLLKLNGKIVIAVPNFKSYDASFYGKFWAAYDVPRHLWHFSENAISKLADEYHFKLIQTKPMCFDAFYVSLLSEKYKYKKVNYFRAFAVGCLSNLKAIKNTEFSSKIYILEAKN
ncbi:class I SAM-dependent methyltransferase [Aquimarina agarivorans]|uniref:class I SAM-dependent methyltransferase n=1 Tax=Aquimarina agarivorans TaxID=980584 RepID=UPI000248F2B2|nr:class I SAM-dependent methyltransferase [Aquimarina agarivorans]